MQPDLPKKGHAKQKTRHGDVCGFSAECGCSALALFAQALPHAVLLVGATGVEPVTYAL